MSFSGVLRAIRSSQSGNVFFALFGAVALVGVVGATSMQVMRGPVRSMSEVTKRTVAENNMIASSKLALLAATSQANDGDCDADALVEPIPFENAGAGPKPAGGGYLPATIGAAINDPWDTRYGYCVWDHGTNVGTTGGCGGGNYLAGKSDATLTGYAIAIISAGPDRTFNTTCSAYPSATALNKAAGSDDVVLGYTYAEASAAAGGLWTLDGAGTAEINKNLAVKDSGGTTTFALDAETGIGDFIGLTTGAIAAKGSNPLSITGGLKFDTAPVETGACTAANTDAFAFDTAGDKLIRCNGANWVAAGGSDNLGNHIATQNIRLASYWLSGDGGNEGIQVNATGGVTTSGTIAPGGDIILGSRWLTGDGTGSDGLQVSSTGAVSTSSTITPGGNIILGSNWLSGDGGSEGIRVDNSGFVGIGTAPSTPSILRVNGSITPSADAFQVAYYLPNAAAIRSNTAGGNAFLDLGNVHFRDGTGGSSGSVVKIMGGAKIGTGATMASAPPANGLYVLGNVGIGQEVPTSKLHVAGQVDVSGNKIINLLDPTAAQDAASKAYVDARVAAGTGFVEADPQVSTLNATKWCVANAGGTAIECTENTPAGAGDNLGDHTATQALAMGTFKITNMADPTTAQDAATKAYVDTSIVAAADDLGNHSATMTLDMNSNKISELLDPTAAQDAATKAYVDSLMQSEVAFALSGNTQSISSGGSPQEINSYATTDVADLGDSTYETGGYGPPGILIGSNDAGWWSLGAYTGIGSHTGTFYAEITVNTNPVVRDSMTRTASGSSYVSPGIIMKLNAGDYIAGRVYQNSGGNLSLSNFKLFGHKVSGGAGSGGGGGDDLGSHIAGQALDMATFKITNLADPTTAQDAATKAYVDTSIVAAADDLGNHSATMTLDMNSNKISELLNPTAAQDAATKKYVDDSLLAYDPTSAETDPQVGTLTNTKWCTTDGTKIDCTSNAPGGSDTLASLSCNDGEVAKWNDGLGVWQCAADIGAAGGDNLGDHIATTLLRSDTHNTDDLGTTAIRWKDGWFAGTVTGGTFAGSGASLTSLNASNLSSGTVPTARLGTGTADITTYLRGDGTWATLSAGTDNLGNHTATTALNMATNKITNLGTPTAAGDATTKGYVDTAAAAAADDLGDHTAGQALDMATYKIINLGTPTAAGDATTKGYVDTAVAAAADNLGNHIATTTLRSDTTNTDDLGTSLIRWKDGWFAGAVTAGTFAGNGAAVTDLNGSNIATGTVAAARLPTFGTAAAGIVGASGGGTTNFLRADGTWAAPPSGADNLGNHIATTTLRSDTTNTDDLGTTAIRWKDGWFAGTVTAGTFAGSGASLTSLPAGNLTGTLPAISGVNLTSLNASNLGSGTVPAARMPALTGDVTMAVGTTATTIAAGAVDLAHMSATGTKSATTFLRGDNTWATPSSSLPGLASTNIWVGSSGGVATAMAMSGDATLSNTGVLTIANSAVGSAQIADNSIAAADLAADSVGASELAANAVGNAEMADNAVGIAELSASGTASSSTFLRGDNQWATPTPVAGTWCGMAYGTKSSTSGWPSCAGGTLATNVDQCITTTISSGSCPSGYTIRNIETARSSEVVGYTLTYSIWCTRTCTKN